MAAIGAGTIAIGAGIAAAGTAAIIGKLAMASSTGTAIAVPVSIRVGPTDNAMTRDQKENGRAGCPARPPCNANRRDQNGRQRPAYQRKP